MIWNVVTVMINHRFITSIAFHGVLHGFRASSGTGTTSLEAKLLHQLTATREEVLYKILMDLHKVYGALDRDTCLDIPKG